MNKMGHLGIGLISIGINTNLLLNNKIPLLNMISFNIIENTILITGINIALLLGNILPDIDLYFNKRNKHYTTYHRQWTHSILIFFSLEILLFLYLFKNPVILKENFSFIYIYSLYILYYILTGINLHIITDIFVGKGGVPIFFKTKNWNSTRRISISLMNNNNFLDLYVYLIGHIFLLFEIYKIINLNNKLIITTNTVKESIIISLIIVIVFSFFFRNIKKIELKKIIIFFLILISCIIFIFYILGK